MTATVKDITVLALNPEQMRPAQESLVRWADDKLRALTADAEEQSRAMEEAARTPFTNQRSQWRRELDKTAKLITFYVKVRDALRAGYIIVPDFPVDVFAVRTDADTPEGSVTWSRRPWRREGVFVERSRALASGEGAYVSPAVAHSTRAFTEPDGKGGEVQRYEITATEFRDVAIPSRLVRPEILDATNKALALKLFDELGLVGRPRQDPIIVGKIVDPRDPSTRRVSFFVAWWLDTATL